MSRCWTQAFKQYCLIIEFALSVTNAAVLVLHLVPFVLFGLSEKLRDFVDRTSAPMDLVLVAESSGSPSIWGGFLSCEFDAENERSRDQLNAPLNNTAVAGHEGRQP